MDAALPTSAARSALGLAASFAVVFAAAACGAQFMPGPWYECLSKPPLNPPNWIFGPVWTALYGMMAVAAWRVWRKVGFRGGRNALVLFGLQLIINAAWSALFFGARQPLWALIDIAALWLAILATIWAFARIDRVAAGLLVPYFAWVTFASYLNAMLWWLNR
jgi:tryptophan-rich sensory protein